MFSERLKIERTRLGLKQTEFAEYCGVKSIAQSNYERGNRKPDSDYLQKAYELGVDIQYLITGKPSHTNINTEEAFLLQQFRQLTSEQKKMMLGFLLGGFTGMNQPTKSNSPVVGGNNSGSVIVGDKSVINNIKTEKIVTRTKAEVKPNETHISEKMARKIKDLVDEIVQLESKVKRYPKGYPAVWGSLNKHCGVTQYHLIPLECYPKAEKYLRQWIGRLSSSKSAPKKVGSEWRKKKYAYIKLNTKQYNLNEWLDNYLYTKYGVISISELNDTELQKVYLAVSSKKRR
ncbi:MULTISPECIES: helix-turn-helix domain-containing protein [Pasteurellaceae]|uniref:Helix-turn-helix transcriptional regulator n=1 Tax=Pasteurella atlantica TaxID=2827233 RepID=A0AAW8CQE4_9PAST|nr:helix-turn-helix transcriptional regulator [Pasteurella atlantica]MBR0573713.1 helix-turn-helix transcriptional regulator [Pasteurella atlantica]MDP8039652.1 helix-turn-helix transcriptional regulator [Pasteurella atlantica]MDP8041743.1 helix-turn-helix transcriptional regulator [Pasteurella atlantica]MDP8043983.1 helix-turn-helix transcriptional regulator [Pasteurella atlantica]MDP8045961.1 helix-turn-helix transcriptional regulator [Pasteurella atlantica]